jgi:hypothetical protein
MGTSSTPLDWFTKARAFRGCWTLFPFWLFFFLNLADSRQNLVHLLLEHGGLIFQKLQLLAR